MATNIGNTDVRQTYEKQSQKDLHQKITTITKRGPYDDLEDEYDELKAKSGGITRKITLNGDVGGLGELIIAEYQTNPDPTASSQNLLDEWYEIDIAQFTVPIFANEKLVGEKTTDAMKTIAKHITAWDDAEARLRINFKYMDENGSEAELTADEKVFANLYNEGTRDFLQFTPIVRKISVWGGIPETYGQDIGKKDDPPTKSSLANEWLKTTDRISQARDKTWTRVEEWTGQFKWSDDLYETVN